MKKFLNFEIQYSINKLNTDQTHTESHELKISLKMSLRMLCREIRREYHNGVVYPYKKILMGGTSL